jgi:hypothetical protein
MYADVPEPDRRVHHHRVPGVVFDVDDALYTAVVDRLTSRR